MRRVAISLILATVILLGLFFFAAYTIEIARHPARANWLSILCAALTLFMLLGGKIIKDRDTRLAVEWATFAAPTAVLLAQNLMK